MTASSRALLALLAWGALSFGAVYPWGYWPLAAGAAALGAWAIGVTRAWHEPRPRAIGLAFAGIGLALVVQIIPLPYPWFRTITPAADRLLAQLQFGWAGHPPDTHALSIAPESTVTALLLLVAFGVLLVGLMRAVSYMPLGRLISQLTLFGTALAVFGVVQRVLAGASDVLVYGFWRPQGLATPFGPFINRNHFAGWMLMVLPLTIAAAAAGATTARRPFVLGGRGWLRWMATTDATPVLVSAMATLVMTTSLVLTGSRSGLASLVVALAVLAWLGSRQLVAASRRAVPAFAFAVLILAAVGWVGVARTAARFDQAGAELSERVAAWRDTLRIIRDFPIVGTGVGGYGTAMLVYQTTGRQSIYEQAHNEYLQLGAEGGVLVVAPTVIALVVIVRFVRHRLNGADAPPTAWLRAGAVAGLAGIATQSLLEFSLQMPGNALMFVVVLAIALHRPSSHADAHRI